MSTGFTNIQSGDHNKDEFWVTNKDSETILSLQIENNHVQSRIVMANSFAIFRAKDFISVLLHSSQYGITSPENFLLSCILGVIARQERISHISWLRTNMVTVGYPPPRNCLHRLCDVHYEPLVIAFLEYDTCDDENEYTMMMNSNHEELAKFTTLVGIPKMRSTTKSKIVSSRVRHGSRCVT